MRNKERFTSNSRACSRQLLLWTSGAVRVSQLQVREGKSRCEGFFFIVRRHPLLPAAATPREPRTQPQAFPRGPSGPWSHAYHGPGDPPPRAPDGTTSATARTQPKWAPPHSPCEHTHIGPGDARRADDGPASPGGDANCRAGGQHGALPVLGGIPGTCAVPLTTLHWPACMPAAHGTAAAPHSVLWTRASAGFKNARRAPASKRTRATAL